MQPRTPARTSESVRRRRVGERSRSRSRGEAGGTQGGEGRVDYGDVLMNKTEWPLWEIFIRSQHGLAHKHVGSLHAADAEMAMHNARDVYTRRNEGVSLWVVRSSDITASSPGEKDLMFEPANNKV